MPNPTCRVRDCTAEPTHILLMHSYTWDRTAVAADQAPDVVAQHIVTRTDTTPIVHAKPQAYYCAKHAKEKSRGK